MQFRILTVRFVPSILQLVDDLCHPVAALCGDLLQPVDVLLTLLPQPLQDSRFILPHSQIFPVLLCFRMECFFKVTLLLQELVKPALDLIVGIRILQRKLGAVDG